MRIPTFQAYDDSYIKECEGMESIRFRTWGGSLSMSARTKLSDGTFNMSDGRFLDPTFEPMSPLPQEQQPAAIVDIQCSRGRLAKTHSSEYASSPYTWSQQAILAWSTVGALNHNQLRGSASCVEIEAMHQRTFEK